MAEMEEIDGRDGHPGPPGATQGLAGMNGSDGEPGPVGPQGPVDPQGPVGPVGPQGLAGINGSDGEQGPVGPHGLVGAPGLDGRNGSDGSPGPPGTVPDAVIEQLREDILEEVRKQLVCIANSQSNLLLHSRRYWTATPLLHLGTTGSTLPLDHCRYTARWKPTIAVTSLEDGGELHKLICLIQDRPALLHSGPSLLH